MNTPQLTNNQAWVIESIVAKDDLHYAVVLLQDGNATTYEFVITLAGGRHEGITPITSPEFTQATRLSPPVAVCKVVNAMYQARLQPEYS